MLIKLKTNPGEIIKYLDGGDYDSRYATYALVYFGNFFDLTSPDKEIIRNNKKYRKFIPVLRRALANYFKTEQLLLGSIKLNWAIVLAGKIGAVETMPYIFNVLLHETDGVILEEAKLTMSMLKEYENDEHRNLP